MKTISYWKKVFSLLKEEQKVFLAMVVDHTIHSPGTTGAKLLVTENKEMMGTIGGGIMEYELVNRAQEILSNKNFIPEIHTLNHNKFGSGEQSGMICAGKQTNLYYVCEPEKDRKTVDEMVHAIGISGCHNHTIGCPTAGKLTMMKNTVDPMAVQSGVFAALMAKKGYSGTERVFEGKEGFMDTFIGWDAKDESMKPTDMEGRDGISSWAWDIEALVGELGNSYKIMECGMKAFPTEALTHTHLSCLLNAMISNNLEYSDIKEVRVTCFAQAYDILFDPTKYRPESRETETTPYPIAWQRQW